MRLPGEASRQRHLRRGLQPRLGRPPRRLLQPKTVLTSVPITYTSGEQIEVYRFSIPVTVGVPLLALFLQAFRAPAVSFLFRLRLAAAGDDFLRHGAAQSGFGAVYRGGHRSAQDMLGAYPSGSTASRRPWSGTWRRRWARSWTWKTPEHDFWSRWGFIWFMPRLFHGGRGMVSLTLNWSWSRGVLAGLANAVLGVGLYFMLDKFKQRT
jgi:hypothetical protein